MPRPERESTWTDVVSNTSSSEMEFTRSDSAVCGVGSDFTSSGSFVYHDQGYGCDATSTNGVEIEQIERFREYIDEDCECPTRRKVDEATAELARLIHNYLVTTNQMDMGEHKDMIFESAQRIIRAVTP